MRSDFWDEYCGVANGELLTALTALQGTIGLAILANSEDGARDEEERRFGFAALFDPICCSHETGFSELDPRAFDAAPTRMDAQPGDVLFIDDRPVDVEAARSSGLAAHLHRDTAGTLARIAAFARG